MGPYTKNAYDATNIIIAALKQAGLKDRAAIAKAIRDIQYDGAMGHTSFDSNGQTTLPVDLELREVRAALGGALTSVATEGSRRSGEAKKRPDPPVGLVSYEKGCFAAQATFCFRLARAS